MRVHTDCGPMPPALGQSVGTDQPRDFAGCQPQARISTIHHLDTPAAVFDAMLAEFDRQQAARGLAVDTRRGRERLVQRLRAHADAWPWEWTPRAHELCRSADIR